MPQQSINEVVTMFHFQVRSAHHSVTHKECLCNQSSKTIQMIIEAIIQIVTSSCQVTEIRHKGGQSLSIIQLVGWLVSWSVS